MEGSRDFAEDRWALFDLTTDFSEATDVAADHPDVVRRLEQQWLIEAGRNDVMPLSHGLASRLVAMISPQYPIGSRATFRPVDAVITDRSEEHTSELQSIIRKSYAVFSLKKKQIPIETQNQ